MVTGLPLLLQAAADIMLAVGLQDQIGRILAAASLDQFLEILGADAAGRFIVQDL